ncbi:MAG: hypothetical protein GY856_31255 [bacterium]|nr:hypothetical protein [bacterium]
MHAGGDRHLTSRRAAPPAGAACPRGRISRRSGAPARRAAAGRAEPTDRDSPLTAEVLDALFPASGGLPALVTYGLQELWKLDREPTAADVTALFKARR